MNRRVPVLLAVLLGVVSLWAALQYWEVLQFPSVRHISGPLHLPRLVEMRIPVLAPSWTDQDRAVQLQLQEILRSREPTHRVVCRDGRVLKGSVQEVRSGSILFSEQFGEHGSMSLALPKERIVRVEPLAVEVPDISLRDVRFFREFSGKHFYKTSPYTILTEDTVFEVGRVISALQVLYDQFSQVFSPLVQDVERKNDIQVLFLSDAEDYQQCLNRYAPELSKSSSGFYSVELDRLTVLHQRHAEWMADGNRQIADLEAEHLSQMKSMQDRQRLLRWKQDMRGRLLAQAERQTRSALRHEGAHQLAYTLGLQSRMQAGRGWVSEGLACWFETESPGDVNEARLADLNDAVRSGRVKPLADLLSAKNCETPLDYAQAWSLVYMLMKPEWQDGWFAYLDWLRHHPRPAVADAQEELCRFLQVDGAELERRWGLFVNSLK